MCWCGCTALSKIYQCMIIAFSIKSNSYTCVYCILYIHCFYWIDGPKLILAAFEDNTLELFFIIQNSCHFLYYYSPSLHTAVQLVLSWKCPHAVYTIVSLHQLYNPKWWLYLRTVLYFEPIHHLSYLIRGNSFFLTFTKRQLIGLLKK